MALDFKKAHAAVNSEWLNQVEEEKKTKAANTAKQKANYKSVKKTTGKSKNIAKTIPYNTAKDTGKTTTPTSNTGTLSTNKSGRDTKHTKQGTIPYNTKSTYLQNKAAEEEKTKAASAVITQNTQIGNNVNNIINNGSVIDRNQHKQVLNTVKPETENYSNGQFAKQVVKTGVQSYINEGLAKTADFILPDFITPEPVQKVLNYYEKTGETAREDLVKMSNGSKVKEVAGNLGAGAIGMLPNLIIGWASAAAKGAQLTGEIGETAVNALSRGGSKALSKFAAEAGTNSTTLGNTLATIAREKAQSPTFWTSFSQMLGTTYYNEKESGATDAEATASAFVNALMGAAVEDQGGIEKFNPNETVAQAFKRSFLEEASEEGLQGIIERTANKAFGSDTNKWVSLNPEEEAVFNPYTTAEEMAYGGVLGGIMGGGRAAVNNTTSNVMNKFITDNMPTNKVPTNTQTVSGDPIQQAETQLSQLKTDAGIVRAETQAETKTDNASQWKEGDSYSYPGKNSPQDPAAYQYEVVSQGSDGKTRHTFFTDEKKAQANADNYNAMFGEGAAQVVNLQNEGELYNAVQQVTGNRAASQAESETYLTQQTGKTADQLRAESENLFNQQQASINNSVQENYNENGGDIRQALQNTENKPKNIPYNYDLATKEGRMAAKVTDEKTENQIAALSKVFKRNISFSTDFEEGVHGKHDLNTGDIVINAAAVRDGQSVTKIVLGHELTHGLEKTRAYKAMSNVIERYIDSQEGVTFREQVEKLRNSYQNEIKGMSDEEAYEYLKQEYIAEFAGNYIFNNEEFINRLCKEDRSTFERVKEWIQDTINKLTSKDEAYKMLTDARRLYDRAARQSIKKNNDNDKIKYSKVIDDKGEEYVLLEDNILDGKLDDESQSKYIMDYIATYIGDVYNIISDNKPVYIGEDLPSEYYYSKDSQYKRNYRKDLAYAKLQAAQDIKEIVEIAKDGQYEANRKSKHNTDAKNGFYKYSSRFGVKTKNSKDAKIYDCTLIVRNAADGKNYLYDIIVNKKVGTHSLAQTSKRSNGYVEGKPSVALPTNNSVTSSTTKSNRIPYNFTTKTWSTDAYSGQVDMRKTIYAGDKEVGYLEYSVYDETPSVQYIHVDPEYRRSGAAKQLMQELQKEYPDTEINFGMTTEDGTKLLENISEERQNTDVINANKEIKQIRAQREELENRMDKYVDDYPAETRTQEQWDYIEEAGAEWDRLYKRERELENEYRGKSETSTFIKLSKGEGLNANTESEEKLYNKSGFNQNKDNEGRKLSKEQQQYFAQSKVRDDNGNLMTMYHGSAEQFDTFDIKKAKSSGTYGRGFYFTDSDSHAGQYGKRMEVYLNITDPLQHGTNNITKEQLTKYVQSISDDEDYGLDNYGYGATVDSVVNSVWGKDDFSMLLDLNVTAIGDMAEAVKLFNNVNGTNYDGIIAPTETVAFYPNQIKQVTNQNPTVNSNTKLSKGTGLNSETTEEEKLFNNLAKASETSKQFTGKGKKKVEAARNLIAVHNMTGEELAKTLKLGGLPMPSIAIIKAEMGHDMYGPVSLVFHKDSIDPKANKANKVYGADAYTPTYPQIDYKVNREALNAVYEDIAQQIQGTGLSASGIEYQDQVESRLSSWRGDYAEAFNNDEALKYAYLKEKGESVDVPQTEERLTSRYGNDDVKEIYDRIVDKNLIDEMASYKWYENNPETAEAIANVLNSKNNRAINEKGRAEKGSDWVDKWHEFYKPEDISFHDYDLIMRGVKKLNDNGGVINQTNDVYELKRLLNDTVKYNDPDFRQWINDKFQGVTEKEGIYNGKDLFTYSGNRRSWEALHYEHNLENVVKTMKNDISQGKGFGGMNLFGSSAEKLSNLNQVKEREGQLYTIPQEEYEAMRNDFASRFNEITNEMTRGKGWQAQDDASNVLLEALTKYKTKSGMDSYIREQTKGWADYNSYMLDDFMDIVTGIRQMPTGYFEAKPERAMNIGEVATVIVPSDINPEILSQMNDYGLDVRTYKPGDEAERKQILNSLDELKFRKAAGLVADTEAEQKMYSDLERASQITSKKFQQQNIPYNRPAETVTPETTTPEEATVNTSNIQAPVQETRKAQEYTKRSGRNFRDNLLADLHITRWADSKAMKTYTDELQEKIKTGTLTEADKERLFMDILAEGEVINQDKADTYGDLVTDLKNRTFYVSRQTSNNITDYNAFRHDSKLKLSSKGGAAIDDIYQHSLQAKYGKEMFPDLNTPEEMLEQIDKVYKDATDVYTPLSQMSESQLDEAMTEYREKFDKAVEQLGKDLNIAKRYNDFRANKSTEETFNDYNQLNYYKKAAERVKNKVLLTDEDRADLKMLHKGTLTEEQLRTRNENADNVLKVYEAEKPVMQLQEQLKKQGDETHAKYREIAEGVLANSDNWKEKKAGIRFSTDTAERNMEDLAGMAEGFMINDNYFTPIHDNEAKSTRMKNDYRDEVRKLNISEKPVYNISKLTNIQSDELQAALQENGTEKDWKVSESALVQMYGEGLLDKTQLTELGADVEKIENAVATMRNYYEQMLDQANQVLILHGYEPIAHRQNYFPHFTETKPDSIIAEIGSALGFNVKKDELPTDIAGLTHTFKPGKKWFGNALERKGKRTEYDALEGFDRYVEGIGDVIFHTADIQKLRAFESELRYKYSEQGQKDRLDEINNNPNLSEIEKEAKRQAVYEAGMTKHGTLAQWIRRYTDTLAGKKSMSDREMEYQAGRKSYGIVKSLENRVAANMVALNPGSWLTNFIPLVQGSEVKNSNIIKGMAGAVQNLFQDDGFKDRSTFLTNRAGTDTLVSSNVEKITDTLTKPMEWIDTFTSQSLVRAKYLQGIQEGKEEWEAMEEADRFAANVIADRSKGSLPLIFESKNPLTKILTMYQVEVNNQWNHLFKDIPRTEGNVAKTAAAYAKFAIGAYIFNDVFEKVVGRRPALDPLSWLNDLVGDLTGKQVPNFIDAISATLSPDDDEEDENVLERLLAMFDADTTTAGNAVANLAGNVAEDLPFIGGVLGGGRVPIQSALPDVGKIVTNTADLISGDANSKKAWSNIANELSNPLTYIVPPVGGGQAKKVYQSTKDILAGGNYAINSKGEQQLRYAVDNTYENWIKGLLFGQYALEGGQEYIKGGYKQLNALGTTAYDALRKTGVKNSEAEAIIRDVNSGNKADKIAKLQAADLTAEQKNTVAEILDITSYKKEPVEYTDGPSVYEAPAETEETKEAENTTTSAAKTDNLSNKQQKYVDALTEAGLDTKTATDAAKSLKNYNADYIKAATLMEKDYYTDDICEALGIDDKAIDRAKVIHDNGYDVFTVNKRWKAANADNKGAVTQEEAKNYLDKQNMSKKEKAAWWKILTGGSDKRNPYN